MYTQEELAAIDRSYFAVIVADEYDVTLMSLNTRHMWQLHNVELPDGEVTVLEFGHAKRCGGRTRAFPHIAPAEQAGIEQLTRDIERDLQKGG